MSGRIIICVLLMTLALNLCFANGNRDWPNDNEKLETGKHVDKKNLDVISRNRKNREIHDLETGLRSLTTSELAMLSKFIDDQSNGGGSNVPSSDGLLGVMENYWERHVRNTANKRQRTIDDVYDEIARDNAGMPIRDEYRNMGMCEKCNCPCEAILNNPNMRMKRENLGRIIENGYSIDEYVKDLENSFPHEQVEDENVDENNSPNHVRIKRF